MNLLEQSMAEIDRAEEHVRKTEVRTKLDSIGASLQEMIDAMSGEETSGDVVLGDTETAGAAPSDENLEEVESNLLELAEETEDPDVREHLSTARLRVEKYRTGTEEG